MGNRTGKIMKNGIVGVLCQVIVLIVSFITRKIFLDNLSITYLGYNGLFTNILGMLNLAELGVGTALTYKFYKPIALNDSVQVSILLAVYKKIYNRIGIFVLTAGALISPFVPYLIKYESGTENWFIILLFIIQLLGTATTYFFSYKRTIFFASQRDYICTITDMVANIIFSLLKIISIIVFGNYVVYLVLQVGQNFASNFFISYYCKKQYPAYQPPKNRTIEITNQIKQTQKDIFKSIKNVFLGKFAIYVFLSTDNIIVSKFVGITAVGLLSNYTLITSTITTFLNKLLDPVQAGFGNLLNSNEDKSRIEQLYYNFQFLQCSIGMIVATCIAVLINPIITLFFGSQFCFEMPTVIILSVNLYLDILQRPSCNYINALGLFKYDKKISFVGAFVNLTLSMFLVQFIGVNGVLLGTTISQILFLVLRSYYVVCRYLKNSPCIFYKIVIKITSIAIMFTIGINMITSRVKFNYCSLFAIGALCVVSECIALFIFFKKTEEFRYFQAMVKKVKK